MKKLKVQKSYALDLITYIVSGLINKYMILTFIYKIVLSSKESRIHNTIYFSVKFLIVYGNRNIYTDLVFKTVIFKSAKTKLMDNLHHVTHFLQLRQQKYVSRNILDEEA